MIIEIIILGLNKHLLFQEAFSYIVKKMTSFLPFCSVEMYIRYA